jgi:SynChlorMet cassette protein ScmC
LLSTLDGNQWKILNTDGDGVLLSEKLAAAMNLEVQSLRSGVESEARGQATVFVRVLKRNLRWKSLPVVRENKIDCRLGPGNSPERMTLQLERLAHVIAHGSEKRGGLLVHGALAEWRGIGVILAGPGGVGKSTACGRLPCPWRSLSDDSSLIVKAADGTYWAHPWPTWSRLRQGDMSCSWDVQAAVKLGLICMLSQCRENRIRRLGSRQAISELVDVSGQTLVVMANGMSPDALCRINLMRFHNAVAIAKEVSICRLDISRSGKFWKEIEKFLVSAG